jgi:hypothetical protein
VLVGSDILSDFGLAYEYFTKGHIKWALLTLALTFAPFLFTTVLHTFKLAKAFINRNYARQDVLQKKTIKNFWELPFFLGKKY